MSPPKVPLDPSLYSIEDDALEFMKASTGIQDPEELKKHILAVQEEAYAVCMGSGLPRGTHSPGDVY